MLEPVIGLEIHVQLATATKLFCGDVVAFGAPANTHVCPVCLGLPGALPALNEQAVTLALRTALALGCTVAPESAFARKRYAYPDLPKGYQITQHERPLATTGALIVDLAAGVRPVRIRRVHLEEDAARLVHDGLPGRTAIDCNRAGVPLLEIVTEPDLATPADARAFLVQLRRLLRYVAVSDCEMETGSLRVDANLSLRAADGRAATARTEVKNMNSFAHVEHALDWEIARQERLAAENRAPEPVTMSWDAHRGAGRVLRTKESSADYGYFDEPDVPPLAIGDRAVAAARDALPELPRARAHRLVAERGITSQAADVITSDRPLADYYEALVARAPDPVLAANWLTTVVLAWLNRAACGITSYPLPAAALAELLHVVHAGRVSNTAARRTVLPLMLEHGVDAETALARSGAGLVRDETRLAAWIDAVIGAHAAEVARYRGGEEKVLGYLMGRLMEQSAGKVDPQLASRLLRRRLEA